ncbi:hypothetical protein ACS0TY_017227 [Phlomoides rotata]
MATRAFNFLPIIHLAAILIYSGSIVQETDATAPGKVEKKLEECVSISTKQKDVTTPMTTVPITNPPMLNPTRSGSESPTITTPTTSNTHGSWCVATQSAPHAALQVALDYACGHGGSDCSEIQPGGRCFDPISVRDHASYAFNSYYQKNPIPTSCNFGGSAVTTSVDPSYDTCQYPSTSTTSSVLNTTNSMGSHVFGARPIITPPPPVAAATCTTFHYFQHILAHFIIINYIIM